MDRLVAWAKQTDTWLVCLPGTDALDPELMASSTVGVPVAHEVLAYLQSGGVQNYEHCLRFLSDHLLTTGFGFDPPVPQPRHGVYYPNSHGINVVELRARHHSNKPTLGILFYRAHYLAGNTKFVDALIHAIEAQGANAPPIFAQSLKEIDEDVYDATARVMDDWMYEQVAQTYALDTETQGFLQKSNPWAFMVVLLVFLQHNLF